MKKQNKLIIKIQRLLKKLNQREYLHRFGPKKYKLKQHLFALLFMQICKLSFRRVSEILEQIGFVVPTYSALCKSRKRISPSLLRSCWIKRLGNSWKCRDRFDRDFYANPSFITWKESIARNRLNVLLNFRRLWYRQKKVSCNKG